MKTDIAPKYIQSIGNETFILWFQFSNRYVVASESLYTLIQLFLSVDDQVSFINVLNETLQIDNNQGKAIHNEIFTFLNDANTLEHLEDKFNTPIKIPLGSHEVSYDFGGKLITINFESDTIKSLIHPQIAHHSIDTVLDSDTTFDIFKTDDDLHLFRDKHSIGHFKTSMFHLLQGKFALELTNTIHDTTIDNWIATFHASTVTNGDQAIMIIGDSGNGKSTLSALLMASKFDLLTDDFTPLYQDLNLYRYPAAVSIKKGAFDILKTHVKNFETLKTYTNGPKKVNLKYLPPLSKFSQSKPFVPCKKVVYVKYDANKASSLNETSLESILATLIPESWISPNETHALQFINWLKELECYELNYSDNDFAISKFKTLFNQ